MLEDKVDILTHRKVSKSDSALAVAATTKLKILTKLNKIEDI